MYINTREIIWETPLEMAKNIPLFLCVAIVCVVFSILSALFLPVSIIRQLFHK